MNILITATVVLFWILLLFYSAVTISGVWYRLRFQNPPKISHYPSVALLIPAHNEEIVIENTLRAMARLKYEGQLDIYVLDDSSKDGTANIVQEFAEVFSRIHYIPVPQGNPKGKSRVLNYGLSITDSDYFVVYDADNEPEPRALEKLVQAAEIVQNAAGAVGYVKTKNVDKNVLTRMIALEFQVFQLLMQCGRWALFGLGSLAGTNMLLRRSVIEELGGYDVFALAEDAELTVRLTAAGYKLPVVPTSRTWEQEPETLKAFIKQRTRWLTGNLYLLEKSLKDWSHWRGRTFILSMQHLLTYFIFVLMLLISDLFFILSISGVDMPIITAPLMILWFMTYIVYTAQLLSAIVIDRNVSPANVLYVLIMYFTYAQIFILLLALSLTKYTWSKLRNKTIAWDKTQRFKGRVHS
ncbi:glycosyltransferase [Planococcus halotolerans]|uniref:Glycosyltransferase family 2 protein n=1 Tax=Planococcus halotolerans TaxID=2233542 RepID=A0A365KNA6_9BACL|nr:glycosyltransferase [Planococcus halotolerans]QHJ71815.1 glycosyltransferase [Planococcus halotolerans]RAZ74575.1 glycosyltransferase family 2 protein [Planococcus halotolerans]